MKLDFINNNLMRFDWKDGFQGIVNNLSGAGSALSGNQQGVNESLQNSSQLSSQVASFLTNLFQNKPNPNDWQGWNVQDQNAGRTIGTSAVWWTITDGDSVRNEADNVQSYIKNYPDGKGLEQLLKAASDSYGLSSQEFLEAFAEKIQRAGYASQASSISSYIKTTPLTGSNAPGELALQLQNAGASTDKTPEQLAAAAQAANRKSTQIMVVAAVVVVAVLLGVGLYLTRKK